MNHNSIPWPFSARPARFRPGLAWKGLLLALPALVSLGLMGCYRASGFQRSTVVAEALPEFGGERVVGLKSMAGPGDYYVGNDFIQVAIDGTPYLSSYQRPIAGAPGGGSIVDAGFLTLDTSYQRVTMPSDVLERLTLVVNQDPSLQFVAETYAPDTTVVPAVFTMTGHLVDPGHRIPGAMWDNAGNVAGVEVTQTLTLGTLDRFLTVSTTLVNNSGTTVGIRSIGDFVTQSSGGYKFVVPAGLDIDGNALAQNWGVQIPGSDFGNPIGTAVQAPYVALVATEPGSTSVDCHASLGFMSTDAPTCMVTSDPQDAFNGDRPIFPARIIVGSLPLPPSGLAPGATLAYNRRLYINGGTSASANLPTTSSPIFNAMSEDRYNSTNGLWIQDYGWLAYTLSGSAMKMGPLPTEVRLERRVRTSPDVWVPEVVDWLESGENVTSASAFPASSVTDMLPTGTYRIIVTNRLGTLVKTQAVDYASPFYNLQSGPIVVDPLMFTTVGGTDYLAPEAPGIVNEAGVAISWPYAPHFFSTRPGSLPNGSFMPGRIVIKGTGGTQDPWVRRARTLTTYFDPITKQVQDAPGGSPGIEQYRAANEMFGTGFYGGPQTSYFWLSNGTVTDKLTDSGTPVISGGTYRAYLTRGPLSDLNYLDLVAYNGQTESTHNFIVWPRTLPSGWTTFDLPGPSQATGGGYLPGEKLASGLAEGVEVIGHTEKDLGTDGDGLYNDFTWPYNASNYLTTYLQILGNDPFVVGARTSVLPATATSPSGFGTATALFTPTANRYRFGGAIQPDNWELSDFITQAQGQFTIIHQPRGPEGLFTEQSFDSTTLAQGFPSWWNHSGVYANGAVNGGFDALELLRGEGFDRNDPDPWFQQFLAVRADWFNLLNVQTPTNFTKALGLSSAVFSLDTPVGLARTYLKAAPVVTVPPTQGIAPAVPLVQDLSTVLAALKSGAAVASTGPFLDVAINGTGPGGLVKGPFATGTVDVAVNLYHSDWMPVAEVRVVLNGQVVTAVDPGTFAQSTTDPRLFTGTVTVTLPATVKGAWVVVEAGVPLTQTGPVAAGTPWDYIMRGIYPIAVTNPIFIDVTGNGYTHP